MSTTVAVGVIVVVIAIAGVGYGLYATLGAPKSTTGYTTTTTSSHTSTTSSHTTTTSTGASTSAAQAYTVKIGSSSSLGTYLENGDGFTLYMFSADTPGNGTSACNQACAALWPPFYATNLNLPSGLNPSSFSTITRSDGGKQIAYNGWPLYFFASDTSAGSMAGEGIDHFGGLWYAIPPTMQQSGGQIIGGSSYSVGIADKPSIGIYLTNSSGFALYYRSSDVPNSGTTTCNTSVCETNWPAFYQAGLTLPPGLSASQFGVITAYNSTKIATYSGYPLFYFVGDSHSGDVSGQGIGGFYAATLPLASGTTTSTTTTTSSTYTTTTSSYTYPY